MGSDINAANHSLHSCGHYDAFNKRRVLLIDNLVLTALLSATVKQTGYFGLSTLMALVGECFQARSYVRMTGHTMLTGGLFLLVKSLPASRAARKKFAFFVMPTGKLRSERAIKRLAGTPPASEIRIKKEDRYYLSLTSTISL